jgi:hypothetical protein
MLEHEIKHRTELTSVTSHSADSSYEQS